MYSVFFFISAYNTPRAYWTQQQQIEWNERREKNAKWNHYSLSLVSCFFFFVVFQCVNSVTVWVQSSRKQQLSILLLVVDKCVTRLTRFVVFASVFWSIFFLFFFSSTLNTSLLYSIYLRYSTVHNNNYVIVWSPAHKCQHMWRSCYTNTARDFMRALNRWLEVGSTKMNYFFRDAAKLRTHSHTFRWSLHVRVCAEFRTVRVDKYYYSYCWPQGCATRRMH